MRWLIERIGFGRKMYTDYEIVCKVRLLALMMSSSHSILFLRPTSPLSNFVTLSYAGATPTLKLSAISSSANPLESISHPFPERSSRIDSQTKLLREEGRDWRDS